VKLLRTIRLDPSDTFIFPKAAEPGEWAVPGAFAFAHLDPATLEGKTRAAFRGGFLGIDTLGWSTLVQIVDATEQDRAAAVDLLARRLVEHFGAPDLATARPAAEEEVAFAASLSNHPRGMLAAVSRSFEDGSIREAFRTLTPGVGPKAARAYAFLEVAGEDEPPADEINLVNLAKGGASS
jgi:orotidine-5'-phosphate decarboxylase